MKQFTPNPNLTIEQIEYKLSELVTHESEIQKEMKKVGHQIKVLMSKQSKLRNNQSNNHRYQSNLRKMLVEKLRN